jgi:hypothetical protein
MLANRSDLSLRNVLWTDAATCVGCGLFMLVAARPFGQLVRLPPELLFYAGVALFPIAAFIASVAARAAHSVAAVSVVIVGNLGWAAASAWVLLGGVSAPTALGQMFVAAQAVVVLALTALEVRGVRRLTQGVAT